MRYLKTLGTKQACLRFLHDSAYSSLHTLRTITELEMESFRWGNPSQDNDVEAESIDEPTPPDNNFAFIYSRARAFDNRSFLTSTGWRTYMKTGQ